jgi:ribosomal protein S18 acetylase RimI-like enzyme
MSGPEGTIVPMTRAHVSSCRAIVAASDPWKTLREGVDFFPSIKRHEAHVCLVNNSVAGFVLFAAGPVFARGGYLRAIGVRPDMRRHGIGRRLLAFAERTTAREAPNLFLCVSSFNRSAQAFYRKCGYRKVGQVRDLVRKGAAENIYWKRLRPPR